MEEVYDFLDDYIPLGLVNKNLNLQDTYIYDKKIEISYESKNPEFVTNEGVRIDHEFDEEVAITCTLKKDGFDNFSEFFN